MKTVEYMPKVRNLTRWLIPALAFSAALSGCMRLSPQYLKSSDYERALILYRGGHIEEARKKALDVAPGSPDYKASLRLVNEIQALKGQLSRSHAELGEELEKAGVYEKAIAEFKTALDYNPDARHLEKRIERLTALKDGPVVRPPEEEKAEKKPKEDPALVASGHYLRGKTYYEMKAWNRAIDECGAALKHLPSYPAAKELLNEARKERDKEIDHRIRKGMGYFQAEEMELAIREWNAVLDLDPLNKKAADYKSRAAAILERLKNIRDRRSSADR